MQTWRLRPTRHSIENCNACPLHLIPVLCLDLAGENTTCPGDQKFYSNLNLRSWPCVQAIDRAMQAVKELQRPLRLTAKCVFNFEFNLNLAWS